MSHPEHDHHHGHHSCLGVSTNLEDYFLTRRQFLNRVGLGLGALGLASVLGPNELLGAESAVTASGAGPLLPKLPHFPGKAKAVIHIFAQGAPSHVDTWDPKPALARMDGKSIGNDGGVAMASPFAFQRYGQSGLEVSDLFAKTGAHADDLTVIRSMFTDIPAHDVATTFMNTGSVRITKPSLGSWVVYGLGTENQNLPGFISLRGNRLPVGGAGGYGSAFLPGVYQGTSVNTTPQNVQQMIQNIRNSYVSKTEQRRQLDFVHQLNELHAQNLQRDAALESRLETAEIAFRMQAEATDVFDINKEPADTRAAYGNTPQGKQLLIARRLVERGVRFVQLYHRGWDHHGGPDGNLVFDLKKRCLETDQPTVALIKDLKQRGLLEDTVVVWGGEFGRTPMMQGNLKPDQLGRDHHPHGYTVWLAGGGIKPGIVYGKTDDFGFYATEDKVHVHDLHATILHLFGLNHTQLTYRFQGRDFRLTDVAGDVVQKLLM